MPVVPDYQEHQYLNVQHPVPIADPREAGIQGEAMAQAGRGLTSFGLSLMQSEEERKKTTMHLDVNAFRQEARNQALQAYDHAIRTGAADGSNYTQIYNQMMDQNLSQMAEGISDPTTKFAAMTAGREEQNHMLGTLYAQGLQDFRETGQRQLQDQADGSAGIIRKSPDQFDAEVTKMAQTIDNSGNILPANERELFKGKVLYPEAAKAAVWGLADQATLPGGSGKWDEAQTMLRTKYAQYLKPEEVENISNQLTNQKNTFFDRKQREEDRQAREDAEAFKEEQKDNGDRFLQLWKNADSPEKRNDLRKKLDEGAATEFVDSSFYTHMTHIMDADEKKMSDNASVEYYDAIYNKGETNSTIEKMVYSDENLSASKKDELIKYLKTEKDKKKKDPSYADAMSTAKRIMNDQFQKSLSDMNFNNEQGIKRANAELIAYKLRNDPANPKNPVESALAAVKAVKGPLGVAPIDTTADISQQMDLSGLQGLANKANWDWISGKIKKQEMLDKLRIYDIRRQIIKLEEECKGRGN
jgi:hypothetical protein